MVALVGAATPHAGTSRLPQGMRPPHPDGNSAAYSRTISTTSTSNTSVAFAGMTPPMARVP